MLILKKVKNFFSSLNINVNIAINSNQIIGNDNQIIQKPECKTSSHKKIHFTILFALFIAITEFASFLLWLSTTDKSSQDFNAYFTTGVLYFIMCAILFAIYFFKHKIPIFTYSSNEKSHSIMRHIVALILVCAYFINFNFYFKEQFLMYFLCFMCLYCMYLFEKIFIGRYDTKEEISAIN